MKHSPFDQHNKRTAGKQLSYSGALFYGLDFHTHPLSDHIQNKDKLFYAQKTDLIVAHFHILLLHMLFIGIFASIKASTDCIAVYPVNQIVDINSIYIVLYHVILLFVKRKMKKFNLFFRIIQTVLLWLSHRYP